MEAAWAKRKAEIDGLLPDFSNPEVRQYGYLDAEGRWHRLLQVPLTVNGSIAPITADDENVSDLSVTNGDLPGKALAEAWYRTSEGSEDRAQHIATSLSPSATAPREEFEQFFADRERLGVSSTKETIAHHAKEFAGAKMSKARSGQGSIGRADHYRRQIEKFRDRAGGNKSIKFINASLLERYKLWLQEQLAQKIWGDWECKHSLDVAKQFVRRLWELELIELPRNLSSRDLTIRIQQKPIRHLDLKSVKRLLQGTEETRRSLISIATGWRLFLEENLSGSPEAETRTGAVVE